MSLAGASALVAWLAVNGEDTRSRRYLATPRVNVVLTEKGPSLPVSSVVMMAEPKSEAKEEPKAGGDKPGADKAGPDKAAGGKTPPGKPAGPKTAETKVPPPGTGAGGPAVPPPVEAERPAGALPKAPDYALLEQGPQGPLPIISIDGRQAWQVYSRPFSDSDRRPRLAFVVTGLGLSSNATETAIRKLPGVVTLSFSPSAEGLDKWIDLARDHGHEVVLDLPMEPQNFPRNDPGPYTLLTSLAPPDNLNRLDWVLGRAAGYVGVATQMGGRFVTAEEQLKPIMEALKRRGLLFLDSRAVSTSLGAKMATEVGVPRAINNRFIDVEVSRAGIDRRVTELDQIARQSGFAVGMGLPYPVTIERIAAWVPVLEQNGVAVAPLSALANKQPAR